MSDCIATELFTMIRGSVTASLIGYALLMHVKEFGQLLIEISSLLKKISRGLYYERMKLSYLCTAEYKQHRSPLFAHLSLNSQYVVVIIIIGFLINVQV